MAVHTGGCVGEGVCGELAIVTLLGDMEDQWIWKLHSSKGYTVKSAYENLTSV